MKSGSLYQSTLSCSILGLLLGLNPQPANAQSIQVGSIRELEGHSGQRVVYLPVSLSDGSVPHSMTISARAVGAAVGGPACTPGVDFIAYEGVAIRARSIPVTICGDTVVEPDKYVRVEARQGQLVGGGDLLIADDDGLPRLTFLSRVSVQRGIFVFPTTPATFTVQISHISPNGADVQIPYRTEGGTAVAGGCDLVRQPSGVLSVPRFNWACTGDYFARNDILRIPAGSLSGTFSIPVIGGARTPAVWFGVNLGQPINAVLGLANTWRTYGNIEPALALPQSASTVQLQAASLGQAEAIAPPESITVDQPTVVSLTWRAPHGQNWQTLQHLDFRPEGAKLQGAWWRWERLSAQWQLCRPSIADPNSRLNARCKPGVGNENLVLDRVTLHPSLTHVKGHAQDKGRLQLAVAVTLAADLAKGRQRFDVAATDVFGNEGGFEPLLDAAVQPPDRARLGLITN